MGLKPVILKDKKHQFRKDAHNDLLIVVAYLSFFVHIDKRGIVL